jgi:hypothetical protein
MLFNPKKYGRDWTSFLAISFYAASIGFGVAAISIAFVSDSLSDKLFGVPIFLVGSIVSGALGRDQWNKASAMSADDGRKP